MRTQRKTMLVTGQCRLYIKNYFTVDLNQVPLHCINTYKYTTKIGPKANFDDWAFALVDGTSLKLSFLEPGQLNGEHFEHADILISIAHRYLIAITTDRIVPAKKEDRPKSWMVLKCRLHTRMMYCNSHR